MTPHTPEGTVMDALNDAADYFDQRGDDRWEFEPETRYELAKKLREMALRPDSSGEAVRDACRATKRGA